MTKYYFTNDGSYGIVDDGFAIINTSDFTSEEFEQIDSAPDSMKLDYALAFRDLKDSKNPREVGQWHNVEDNLAYLIYELQRGNLSDSEVLETLLLIQEGLGITDAE